MNSKKRTVNVHSIQLYHATGVRTLPWLRKNVVPATVCVRVDIPPTLGGWLVRWAALVVVFKFKGGHV